LAEFTRGIGEFVLTFGDELGEGLDGGHGDRWTRRSEGRTMTRVDCCAAKMQRCGGLSLPHGSEFRRAEAHDVPRMLELVRELALFERAPEEVTVNLEHMRDAGFGPDPVWVGWVAELEGAIVRAWPCATNAIPRGRDVGCTWRTSWSPRPLGASASGISSSGNAPPTPWNKDYSGMLWQVLDWNVDAHRFYDRFGPNYRQGVVERVPGTGAEALIGAGLRTF
jgi:hypothetical protein